MEDGSTNKSKEYFDSKLCIQKIGDWLVTDTLNDCNNDKNTGTITKVHAKNSKVLSREFHEIDSNPSRKIWRRCPDNNLRFELDMGVLMPTLKKAK